MYEEGGIAAAQIVIKWREPDIAGHLSPKNEKSQGENYASSYIEVTV